MRVFTDDVDVIEFERRIAHPFAPRSVMRRFPAGILPSASCNDHQNSEGAVPRARPSRRSRWRMKAGSRTPASPTGEAKTAQCDPQAIRGALFLRHIERCSD
jgi:hypothetical protein